MIQKLFGGKKKDYFLEVDEAKSVKSPEQPQSPPQVETKPEPSEAKSPEKTTKAPPKSAKKTKAPKEAPKAEKTPVVEAPPQTNNGKVEPQTAEFATQYLIVPSRSRRLPGPSLNSFKSMARQVKVPRK